MVTGEYWWLIYLVFLAIPLARILPRIMSRKGNTDHYYSDDNYGTRNSNFAAVSDKSADSNSGYENTTRDDKQVRSAPSTPKGAKASPATGQTDEKVVLWAMYKGAKTFESIQKKTGLGDDLLNSALENLEGNKLIHTIQKKGLFGVKIEIHPTNKAFRKYYS